MPSEYNPDMKIKITTKAAKTLLERMRERLVEAEIHEAFKSSRVGKDSHLRESYLAKQQKEREDPPEWATRYGNHTVTSADMSRGLKQDWVWLNEWTHLDGDPYDAKGWEHAKSHDGPWSTEPSACPTGPNYVRRQLWFRVQAKLKVN